MKTKLIYFILLAFFMSSCGKIADKNERESMGLRGSVKSVEEYSFVSTGEDDGDESLETGRSEWNENQYDYKVVFNEDGAITEHLYYDDLGNPMLSNLYHFNGKNLEYVEVFMSDSTENGQPNFVSKFTYTDFNKPQTLTMYNADTVMIMYQEYGYDSNQQPYDELVFDDNHERVGRNFYKYSDDGKMLESKATGPNGEVLEKRVQNYNRRGALIETIVSDGDGTVVEHLKQKVNRRGDVLNYKQYGKNDVLQQERTYHYNKQNDVEKMVVESLTDKTKNVVWYEYEYDDHDNWVKCVETVEDAYGNSQAVYKIVRDLTYYK